MSECVRCGEYTSNGYQHYCSAVLTSGPRHADLTDEEHADLSVRIRKVYGIEEPANER